MIAPEKLKPLLLHEERVVREFILRYFKDSFNRDPDLMPYVLECCNRYPGMGEVRHMLTNADKFTRTEATLNEIFNRLPESEPRLRFAYEHLLVYSPPSLLNRDVLRKRLAMLSSESQAMVEKRLELQTIPTLQLWEDLLDFCHVNDEAYWNEFDSSHGEFLVLELAGRPDVPHAEMLRRLKALAPDEDYGYDAVYLNMLAGELRMPQGIPVWTDHIRRDADLLNETASDALIKTGADTAARAIGEAFPNEEWNFKLWGSSVLRNIKSPLCEEYLLTLLPQETDEMIATALASGLCRQLSVRGIEPVREKIRRGYDRQMLSLEEELYAACRILGVDLPELEQWRGEIEKEQLRLDQINLEDGLFQWMPEEEAFLDSSNSIAAIQPRSVVKIGRNDPCPCGSGKKYKKCCLNR
ncbi:uncharacterized protein YecA (UPF0149 family) [Hydrogenispora ethanolica]|uniref:Uncharacterized protein YecA (UPF0149 family) n=1 Tax=Hydrogenispora ethanolica TaxID=1082276 RepID=A0A4R1SAE6_HYDET|nr:SEC-C metal-binding domain-containing protein [Hydrogenispora ethanolica]TCL76431.1 uncharacterized protein YecA (UPF0149 family) [Hydrogenispora ethanolica]